MVSYLVLQQFYEGGIISSTLEVRRNKTQRGSLTCLRDEGRAGAQICLMAKLMLFLSPKPLCLPSYEWNVINWESLGLVVARYLLSNDWGSSLLQHPSTLLILSLRTRRPQSAHYTGKPLVVDKANQGRFWLWGNSLQANRPWPLTKPWRGKEQH